MINDLDAKFIRFRTIYVEGAANWTVMILMISRRWVA